MYIREYESIIIPYDVPHDVYVAQLICSFYNSKPFNKHDIDCLIVRLDAFGIISIEDFRCAFDELLFEEKISYVDGRYVAKESFVEETLKTLETRKERDLYE